MSLGETVEGLFQGFFEFLEALVRLVLKALGILLGLLPRIDPYLLVSGGLLLLFTACVTTSKVKTPQSQGDMATVVKIEGKTEDKDGEAAIKCSELTLTFQFENKKEVALKVPAGAYGFVKKGDKGRLYYKGDKFEKFVR